MTIRLGSFAIEPAVGVLWPRAAIPGAHDAVSDDDSIELRRSLEKAGLTHVRRLATFPLDRSAVRVAPRPGLTPQMRNALGSLPPRQKLVLELHHGLRDGRAWSLVEIGRKLGLSAENVRRLVENGNRRLR